MRLRPRVEVLCFKRSRVLCRIVTDGNYVLFPGGGIDPSESAIEAAKREFKEEADRNISNLHIAHQPTTQIWPDDYTASNEGKWGKGFQGGFTHWVTASTSQEPLHSDPKERHKDYEEFEWMPVSKVIEKLKGELDGDWGDDVKTRLNILSAHVDLNKEVKKATSTRVLGSLKMPNLFSL